MILDDSDYIITSKLNMFSFGNNDEIIFSVILMKFFLHRILIKSNLDQIYSFS